MTDGHNRTINYMRISITDRCNLRCTYCMPQGITCVPMAEILTYEEIVRVCKQAISLGITCFKITGGEPLVRLGCVELVRMLKALPGVDQVTLTTNGVLLEPHLEALSEAELDGINISLDTLNAEEYRRITGFDALPRVLSSLSAALETGIPIKLNAVLRAGINDTAWEPLLLLAEEQPLAVRFIEQMPMGKGIAAKPVSNRLLKEKIDARFGPLFLDPFPRGNGPATYYCCDALLGNIGFISPIHDVFCQSCNRLRLTATGTLRPCLCYEEGIDVKTALRRGDDNAVRRCIEAAIMQKPAAHCFSDAQNLHARREMASIGG